MRPFWADCLEATQHSPAPGPKGRVTLVSTMLKFPQFGLTCYGARLSRSRRLSPYCVAISTAHGGACDVFVPASDLSQPCHAGVCSLCQLAAKRRRWPTCRVPSMASSYTYRNPRNVILHQGMLLPHSV